MNLCQTIDLSGRSGPTNHQGRICGSGDVAERAAATDREPRRPRDPTNEKPPACRMSTNDAPAFKVRERPFNVDMGVPGVAADGGDGVAATNQRGEALGDLDDLEGGEVRTGTVVGCHAQEHDRGV